MKKVVRLTESDLIRIVKRVIKEQEVSEDNFIDDLMNNNSLISRGVKGLFGKSKKDEMKKDEKPYTITKEIQNDSFDYLNSLNFDKVEKYGRIFYYENGEKSPTIIFDPTDQFGCNVYTKPKLAQELSKKYDLILPKDLSDNIRYIDSYDAGYRLVSFWIKNTEDSQCKVIVPNALYSSEEKILSSPKGNTNRWEQDPSDISGRKEFRKGFQKLMSDYENPNILRGDSPEIAARKEFRKGFGDMVRDYTA